MSRQYKYNDEDEDFDDGWGRQYGESDEEYQERLEEWNDAIDHSND